MSPLAPQYRPQIQTDFRLPDKVREEVCFWQVLSHRVLNSKDGVVAALKSTGAELHMKYEAVAFKYYTAKKQGWQPGELPF